MTNQLTIGELAKIIGGHLRVASIPLDDVQRSAVSNVAYNSEDVGEGDLFWSLEKDRRIAERYVAEAFDRGARGAVVSHHTIQVPKGCFAIDVEDSSWALWQAAGHFRQAFTGNVVTITGVTGKSTTAAMIDRVLSQCFIGSRSPAGAAKEAVAPITLLQIGAADVYVLVESPLRDRGQIIADSHLCRPRIMVITSLANSLPEGFHSEAELISSVSELLANLCDDGLAVLAGDDPLLRRVALPKTAKVSWVGRGSECTVTARDVSLSSGRLTFTVDGYQYNTAAWGRHALTSALSAIEVARRFGLRPQQIADALSDVPQPKNCRVHSEGRFTVIDDTDVCRPADVVAALDMLRDTPTTSRRIAVIGDIDDGGSNLGAVHRQIGSDIVARCGADFAVGCGQNAEALIEHTCRAGMPADRTLVCEDAERAASHVLSIARPGDVVLLKGHGLELARRILLEQETEETIAVPVIGSFAVPESPAFT